MKHTTNHVASEKYPIYWLLCQMHVPLDNIPLLNPFCKEERVSESS